ncbi:Malcavernin [Aphelenchoides bicaudatus]|nr:Malcavernin [Aphelenchoides bicaudatus]
MSTPTAKTFKVKEAGHLSRATTGKDFKEDAQLEIDSKAVTVRALNNEEVLLVVPLYMIVSVGFVVEQDSNIVPLKIGAIEDNADIFDLSVIYTKTEAIAEQICQHLDICFQFVFHEAMNSPEFAVDHHRGDFCAIKSVSSSSVSPLADDNGTSSQFPSVKEVRGHKHCPSTFSLSTSATSISSKNSIDLINEYLTMLSACLTHEELNRFALLLKRWRSKEMPVLEFAQKLMELYGTERKHLLARMKNLLRDVNRDDLAALTSFLQANGITENASMSPLLTGELSFTTESASSALENISASSEASPAAGASQRPP